MAIGMKKSSHEVHKNGLGLLLEKSRLVYSGVTINLFNHITKSSKDMQELQKRSDTIMEDAEFNISLLSRDSEQHMSDEESLIKQKSSPKFKQTSPEESDEEEINDPRTI